MRQLTEALVERTMEAELTEYLGYEKHDQNKKTTANRRNGKSVKEPRTGGGPMEIETPRDREGTFGPQTVPRHRREFRGFDDKMRTKVRRRCTRRG
jgi:transposase-like protein